MPCQIIRMLSDHLNNNLLRIMSQLDLQYLHPHVTSNLSIGLNPTPPLELSATAGTKELSFGGEVGFDTASATLTKYNAGMEIARPDFSVAVML